ncbi:NAD-dependent epimerase/dehydratase family protein [Aggregatilinea lenta]|uniref:NAD-dependent epimerase/dehydratase family protein n=1 Tax=Aggregatilinea lenta TaxID=913108 RepID=UPI000E5A1BC9|nr:NAD-dependent epimerase/dehydratase family protein [Aggregatilinea lenta]
MQFLVTGGAGYLGSALVRRLTSLGHDVRVFDDLSAGDPARLPPDVTFARGDVNDLPRLWTLLQGIDCVYHLAARVSVPESVRYPREYNAVNVGGTVSVLEAMRDVGVKRLVFTSSGAVYGNQSDQPLHEDLPPNPLSPYAVSKLSSEHYIHTIGRLWNVETVSLRIFNAYGPGQQLPVAHPPVVPQFIRQTLGKGSVIIHGSGDQTRDFVYVDDVVDALVRAATAPDVDRRVINVGSGTETSIMALARAIGQVMDREPDVLTVNTQGVGVSRMCADLSLAKALLGYEPHVFLQEGLHRTVLEDVRFAVPSSP